MGNNSGRPRVMEYDRHFAEIKKALWEGLPMSLIARSMGVPYNAVANVKYGRAGYWVEWPDGSIGAMSSVTLARVAKGKGYSGNSKVQQEWMEATLDVAEAEEGRRIEEALGNPVDKAHEEFWSARDTLPKELTLEQGEIRDAARRAYQDYLGGTLTEEEAIRELERLAAEIRAFS